MTSLLIAVLLMTLPCSLGGPCVWPEWFDISESDKYPRGYYPYKFSWETEAVLNTEIRAMVNYFSDTKKMIMIKKNNTLRISKWKDDNVKENGIIYKCEQSFGDSKYLLKKTAYVSRYLETIPTQATYRCMELIQRSRFVAQWRLGEEMTNPQDCQGEFAPVNPWPLVYFPVRKTTDAKDIWKNEDLFQSYPSCPKLGGFLMRAFYKNGEPILDNECKNDYPSSRFEMECVEGEGIRITEGAPCRMYSLSNDGQGAKFNCLANWEDEKYRYSLLMPNGKFHVYIFHCLRMNKNDPTSEDVILFLDTLCRPGSLELSDNYFQIKLRRHPVRGFGDLSDQCSKNQCKNMKYWCAETCNILKNISDPVTTDESIRGTWFLQGEGKREEFTITEKDITLSGMGTFQVYGNLSKRERICLTTTWPFNGNTFEYALARDGSENGCGPRVTQFRAIRVSESVLVMQASGTAPLRPNENMENVEQWCQNNYQDVESYSVSMFKPHWPFFSTGSPLSYGSGTTYGTGTFTLINKDTTTSVRCNKYYQGMIPDMKIDIHLKPKHGIKHKCKGESYTKDNTLKISYQCDHGPSGTILYECLAVFEVSSDYVGIVLKASEPGSHDQDGIPTQDEFYCLLMRNQREEKLPWFYNTAAKCDRIVGYKYQDNTPEPLVRIEPVKFLESSGNVNGIPVFVMLFLHILIFYYSEF